MKKNKKKQWYEFAYKSRGHKLRVISLFFLSTLFLGLLYKYSSPIPVFTAILSFLLGTSCILFLITLIGAIAKREEMGTAEKQNQPNNN